MTSKKQSKRRYRMDKGKAKKAEERGKAGTSGSTYVALPEGMDWFKPQYKEGKKTAIYYLNVIPFIAGKYNKEANEGDIWYRSKFRLGRVGASGEKVVSPATYGQDCPMSALYFEMKDNPDIPKKELDKLGTKERALYYVVDCKDKDKKIRLLDFSTFLFCKILDEEKENEEYEEEGFDTTIFADPVDGRTIKVVFKEDSFMKTNYSKVSKMSFVERKGKVTDSMIDSLEDPISLLIRKSPKQVQAMLDDNDVDGGASGGDDEELEEMTRSELKRYIKENDLEIKVTKSMDDDDIRDAIQEAMGEDAEDEEEEDDIPMDYEDEEAEDEEEEESSDLDEMDRTELKAYIKENGLEVKVKKSMDEDDLREAIQEAEGEEEEDGEDEDDDEDEFFEDDD